MANLTLAQLDGADPSWGELIGILFFVLIAYILLISAVTALVTVVAYKVWHWMKRRDLYRRAGGDDY